MKKPYSLEWWIDVVSGAAADAFMIPLLVRFWVWAGAWEVLSSMPIWVSLLGFVVVIALGTTAKSIWVPNYGPAPERKVGS